MRKFLCLLMLALMVIALTACGTAPKEQSGNSDQPAVNQGENEKPVVNQGQGEQPVQQIQSASVQLKVYYTNEQLTDLTTEERGISYSDDQDKYEKVLALLGEPAEAGHQPLWKDFSYHKVTFENGTLTIDAAGTNQYNFGSTGEAFAIDALKNTFFQFPEVEKISILIDGKPAETLMGHVDISKPLTK